MFPSSGLLIIDITPAIGDEPEFALKIKSTVLLNTVSEPYDVCIAAAITLLVLVISLVELIIAFTSPLNSILSPLRFSAETSLLQSELTSIFISPLNFVLE